MTLIELALPYQRRFIENRSRRKIFVSSRQAGKSWTCGFVLTQKALERPGNLTLCISTGSRAASEIIQKCRMFAEAVKGMTGGALGYQASFDQIRFDNGSRILSLPGSTDGSNLRGYTSACVVVDEAAFIRNLDDIMQAIGPTLSRNRDAELILTTTPAGMNGPFYDMYSRALEDPDWYVQTTTIHQAVSEGLDVDIGSLRSLCPDPQRFAQEYECVFQKEFGSFLDAQKLVEIDSRDVPEGDAHYLGCDIGRTHDRTAMSVFRAVGDDLYLVDLVVMDKADYQSQFDQVRALQRKWRFKGGYVDKGGIGSPMAEQLTRLVNPLVKGLAFTASNKTPMYENMRALAFQGRLFVDRKFAFTVGQDLASVSRLVSDSGVVSYSAERNDQGHGDVVSSMVLGIQAAKDRPVSYGMPSSAGYQGSFRPTRLFG